jgi:hypothetical protein
MLSLIVQIVSPTRCDVNSCPVFTWAVAKRLVVLRGILDDPATEVQFKQKLLNLFVWVPLPVSVCACHLAKIGADDRS